MHLVRTTYHSPLGEMILVCNESHLLGIWFVGQMYFGHTIVEQAQEVELSQAPILNNTIQWLDRYFNGQRPAPNELPLAPAGTSFRQAVWQILCEIPYGEVITYGDIAKRMAKQLGKERMSAQAVGGAIGHNPISVVIPCHRVVGSDGSLTGYAGGIDKKIALLKLESANFS